SDWLTKDRGPLGQALARIFSMSSYEPARSYERTVVQAIVAGSGALAGGDLTMVNLSVGGMQLQSTANIADLRTGMDVGIELDAEGAARHYTARVAWVASGDAGDRFGLELVGLTDGDKALLERLRAGQSDPARVSLVLKT
ncbi:MAG TPA: PilZ domain-containing protein, partial [Myxococcota bacterium]